MPELPKAYTPHDVEGAIYERWLAADVFAPDGAGSTADPALPPFTIIQPPPNITGSLHLGPRPADRGRGPDDPPRPDARPPDAVPARPRPRLDRRPVRPRRDPRQGRGEPPERSGASATSSGCARSSRRPARSMLGQQRRVGGVGRLGPPALHDGRGLGEGRPRRVRAALPRRTSRTAPRRSSTGAPAAGRASATSRSSPTPETGTLWTVRYHLIDAATGAARPRRDDRDRHDPARDDPRRHRGRGPPGRRALPRARRAAACASRSSSATSRSSPTRSSTARSGPAPSKITPAHDHDDHATGLRHGLPALDDPGRRRARSPAPARATTGWTATRRARRSSPTSRRAATSSAATPHEMVIGRCQRSDDVIEPRLKTQWFVRTGAARGARARGDPVGPDADPARAVREDLGALADQHPRLERHRASCGGATGSRPGTARTATSRCRPRPTGPDACEVCGRPAAELPAGPRHLRHVVQLRAVAVLDARLAGRHARPRDASTRRRSWRPATTSSSSGSPG